MAEKDLTPEEERELQSLPREIPASPELEDRIVAELHKHGALRRPTRILELSGWKLAAAVAACVVLLVGGFTLGRLTATTAQTDSETLAFTQDPMTAAAELQRAGTDYIRALDRFAAMSDTVSAEGMSQGREVALITLYTAADQVTRIVPRELLASQFLQALAIAEDARQSNGQTGTMRAIQF